MRMIFFVIKFETSNSLIFTCSFERESEKNYFIESSGSYKKQERGEKITNKKRKSLPNQKKPAHTKIKRRERQKKKR
jgi:hypothetical protein